MMIMIMMWDTQANMIMTRTARDLPVTVFHGLAKAESNLATVDVPVVSTRWMREG
jgi:hypothetical protein